MSNRMLAVMVGVLFAAGFALLDVGDAHPGHDSLVRAGAIVLMVVPAALASGAISRRRRHASRADDPSSLEFDTHREASVPAFRDGLILAALMVLGLAMRPGDAPAVWGVGFLVAIVVDYWVRYHVLLGRLGG